jgi:twitching motility protein PilT
MINLRDLLQEMIEKGASDLHLTAGLPPMIRVDGEVLPTDREALTPEQTQALAYSVLNEEQQKRFEAIKELDFSFGVKGMSRFRGNAYLQRGCMGLAIRRHPDR